MHTKMQKGQMARMYMRGFYWEVVRYVLNTCAALMVLHGRRVENVPRGNWIKQVV